MTTEEARRRRKNEASKRWRERNPEVHRAAVRKWQENNRGRVRDIQKRYVKNHADRIKEQRHQSREQNPERVKAHNRRNYLRNGGKEKSRLRARQRRASDPKKVLFDYRKWRYGITREEYEAMFQRQGERCASCGSSEAGFRGWHIDHCHTTGIVRGILCRKCNLGIGYFDDDTEKLLAAVRYLEKFSGKLQKTRRRARSEFTSDPGTDPEDGPGLQQPTGNDQAARRAEQGPQDAGPEKG